MDSIDDRIDALVGRRVSLRHRIAADDHPGPRFSDAVGELSRGADGTVILDTRRGPVRVERSAVVAVRGVPAAPARRPSWSAVSRLERLCADAWPPVHRSDLGGWRLRAAGGFTHRANSALAADDPGLPIEQALVAVREFSARHRIPPVVATPQGSPWSRRLHELGWAPDPAHAAGSEVATLVADLAGLAASGGPDRRTEVRFDPAPSPSWWELFDETPDDPVAADRARVIVPGEDGPETGFGHARRDGRVLGAVRVSAVEDHLYLSRLQIDPSARRTGMAACVTADAARWGLERGLRWAVLQVALHNDPARALYARLGCTEHHRYHYLVPGPDASA